MKSFCIITYGCLVYLMCMISLNGIAQLIHKVPQEFNLKATSFSEHFAKKNVYQKHTSNTSLKKEQHFDIYYPSYDSLDYELTQGVFWRIHQDFEPEEYLSFLTPYDEEDSINIKFKNAAVSFNWLNDSFNEDSVTVAFDEAGSITVDTIFYLYGHVNRSGNTNTLRTRLMPVNTETGQPILDEDPFWENVLETDTSLTAPNNSPDSISIEYRILPVNFTLPENEPFAVVVDFNGGDRLEDEFNLLATFNQPCGNMRVAQQSKFYANSYYETSFLIGGIPTEQFFPFSDLRGIGYDFDDDMIIGESEECENFYIQNWHIGATVTFDVAFKAEIVASADTICKNEAVELSGKGLFGEPPYNYNWSPTNGLTQATDANTIATPTETTTYTLTVQDATEVETKLNYTIYVNDLALDLGEDVLVDCGSPYQAVPKVTNSFGNEISFQWNNGQTTDVTPLFPGNYQLKIQDANCEATDDILVGLSNANLVVDFNADNIFNAVVKFENLSENANFYNWDFDDGNTSSEENPQHAYISGGTYQVSLNASSGNCSFTRYATIVVGTASEVYSIEATNEILIGPNPVKDVMVFKINPSFLSDDFEVCVFDTNGQLNQKNAYNKHTYEGSISLSHLSSGIYFVSIRTGLNFYHQKIVISH